MKDLVKIIRENPGCIASIDNDSWTLERKPRSENPYLAEEETGYSENASKWDDENILARASEEPFKWPEGEDFASCCYGGDILQALAIIAGIKVQGV